MAAKTVLPSRPARRTPPPRPPSLRDIPNIGTAMEADLHLLGITRVEQLKTKDPLKLYRNLQRLTGSRQDPCVLDTFMAAVDFAQTGTPRPWWAFTARRKAMLKKK